MHLPIPGFWLPLQLCCQLQLQLSSTASGGGRPAAERRGQAHTRQTVARGGPHESVDELRFQPAGLGGQHSEGAPAWRHGLVFYELFGYDWLAVVSHFTILLLS